MEYIFDEAIDAKWDGIELRGEDNEVKRMIYHCTDGTEIDYGLYDKTTYDRMVDDHVNHKFPFLAEPLKPENINIDGAIKLLEALMSDTREVYILQAKALRKHGFRIPTSSKEFKEYGISARVQAKIKRLKKELEKIDKALYPKEYAAKEAEINQAERELGGMYRTIRFMESGAGGAVSVLKLTPQDIMTRWKQEALGYV